MSYLEKNLELWSHYHPQEAIWLGLMEGEPYPLASLEWKKTIRLKNNETVVVYGIDESLYPEFEAWLKDNEKNKLVFFEDNLKVLKSFFDKKEAAELLKNTQVELHYIKSLDESERTLDNFYWSTLHQNLNIITLPRKDKEIFDTFKNRLLYDFSKKKALVDEYLEYSVPYFRNFYRNILQLDRSFIGNKLFRKFKKVPAIISGAGPSLEKHFDFLKGMEDRALIFAGGSSLNALSFHGINPHFGCGLDPNSLQVSRLQSNLAPMTPFFYRGRFHYQALELVQGPRLYVTGGGGYDLPDYFEEQLKIPHPEIEEGHNVVNFMIEIATRLGCYPIILVGLDLAFTDMKIYSKGIVAKESVTEKELLETGDFDSRAIVRMDIHGNPVYTHWKWLAEADWIGNFQKEHPKQKIINCTEGGLKIEGIIHAPLKETAEKWAPKSYDLAGWVHSEIMQSKKAGITEKKLKKITLQMKKSLEKCVALMETLIADADKRAHLIPVPDTGGAAALAEMELGEEPGFQHILAMFNAVYSRLQNRSLMNLKTGLTESNKDEIDKEKLKLQNERVRFLKNAAEINLKLIDWALMTHDKEKKDD